MKESTKNAIVRALILTSNREEAAQLANVSTRTIREALTIPEVQDEIRRHSELLTLETSHRLASAQADAVKILRDIAVSSRSPDYVRMRAAKDLLDLSLRYTDTADIEARLRALEEAQLEREGER